MMVDRQPRMAIILISTWAFFGRVLTATVSRAGKLPEKYFPYHSFTEEKRSMSDKKMVVFTTWLKSMPAAFSTALRLCITWWVSVWISAVSRLPVWGLMATCPERNNI